MKGTTQLKSVTLIKTPNLTRFLSTKTTITLQKGVQKIRVVGEVGGFNFDRMKIGNPTNGGNTGGGNEGSDDIFWFRNVATGKLLGEGASSAQPVVMHDAIGNSSRQWEMTEVPNTAFINIDNMQSGIIRATGGAFEAGAYLVVTTTKASPATDSDKVWTPHYNQSDKTYRFEAGTSGRFLYHDANGAVVTKAVEDTDTRSKWQVSPTSQPLSISDQAVSQGSIKIYPNPAKNNFTIKFQNIDNVKNVEIYDILGKRVYQNSSLTNVLKIENTGFKSGIYLIKTLLGNNKVMHTKLLVK